MYRMIKTYHVANFACFAAGMSYLWIHTHDWRVIGAAFLASLHFVKGQR